MAKLIYLFMLAISVSALNCAQENRCSLLGSLLKFVTCGKNEIRQRELKLINAAAVGDASSVEQYILLQVNLDAKDVNGFPAIIQAARNGHEKVIAALIQAKATIELRDTKHGSTALMFAAQNGHTSVVELLLKAGSDIHAKSNGGNRNTALIFAAQNGHTKIVELLLKAGADVHAKSNDEGHTSLIFAAKQGHHETMQLLILYGANVNEAGRIGTALYAAAINGHESAVKVLLQNPKIDINNSGHQNYSVLYGACSANKEIIVALLLSENELDLGEFVVGSHVIQYRNPVIRNLIKSKINNWHAQLFEAVRERKLARVLGLIDKAKEVLFFNSDGDNLLHAVIKNIKDADPRESAAQGDADAIVLKLLIVMNPELLLRENKAGITPIDLAAGKPQILSFLFDIAYAGKKDTPAAMLTGNASAVAMSDDGKYMAKCTK